MNFANPEYGLIFFLFFIGQFVLNKKSKHRFFIDHSSVASVGGFSKTSKIIRFIYILRYLTLAFLIVALMRPQEGEEKEQIPESGVDIVLAVDTSGSMKALDFEIDQERVNRLQVVKKVLKEFINNRRGDRMSIVTFGETAFTLAPLTSDVDSLMSITEELEIGMAGEATAIGSAMGVAINRLKQLDAQSKIIILLTDGRNNAGKVGPIEMSDVAREVGAKVYTIGIGKIGGRAPFEVDSFFGKRTIYQNVDLDVGTLTKIAENTGGIFFNATNMDELNSIYGKINELEKREIKVHKFVNYKDHYFYFLFIGIFILILEVFFRTFRLKSFP
jgi:Ca-activated chloride channel homolog